MQILPIPVGEEFATVFQGVIAELDRLVDKGTIEEPVIASKQDAEIVAEQLKSEREIRATVETKIEKFSSLASKVHRFITGKRAEYTKHIDANRLAPLNRALVKWDDACEAADKAEAERVQKLREDEEKRRRKAESKELTKQGKIEEANEVKAAPMPAFHIPISSSRPSVAGVGMKKSFVAQCEDLDALILAIARPTIMREIARRLREQYGVKATKLAAFLDAEAMACPIIHGASIFASTKGAREAIDTQLSKHANTVQGKMQWPGVSVREDKKTTTRK